MMQLGVPSPSDYLPLDSGAPAVFRSAQISKYIYMAVAILVLYDHAITLDVEVERIWTTRYLDSDGVCPKFYS